jgi:hypothetical protein
MPIDSGLYANIGRGQRTWQDLAAADQAMEANKLTMLMRQQQADEAKASAAEREALRGYFSTPGLDMDSPDFEAGLYRAAPGLAPSVEKQRVDILKARNEAIGKRETADKTRLENIAAAVALHRDQLANVKDGATAAQWLLGGYADPLVGPVLSRMGPASQAIKRIPQDADGLANWVKQNGLGATKYIEKNAPTYSESDLGGTKELLARPGLGGSPQVVRSAPTTATPGQIMSNDTVRRGQDIAATTARETGGTVITASDGSSYSVPNRPAPGAAPGAPIEARPIVRPPEPGAAPGAPRVPLVKPVPAPRPELPPAAAKQQDAHLEKIASATQRANDLGALRKMVDGGTLELGPIANATAAARNFTGNSSENSLNYDAMRQQMTRIVNEGLRMNAGVQTEGDAKRMAQEVLDNLKDGKLVSNRLQRIQGLIDAETRAEKERLRILRKNYSREDLDTTGVESSGAVVQDAAGGGDALLKAAAAEAARRSGRK